MFCGNFPDRSSFDNRAETISIDHAAKKLLVCAKGSGLEIWDIGDDPANPADDDKHRVGVFYPDSTQMHNKGGGADADYPALWEFMHDALPGTNSTPNSSRIYMSVAYWGYWVADFTYSKDSVTGQWSFDTANVKNQIYDCDRCNPTALFSGDSKFDWRGAHTAIPFDNEQYFLTTDEMGAGEDSAHTSNPDSVLECSGSGKFYVDVQDSDTQLHPGHLHTDPLVNNTRPGVVYQFEL